MGILAIKRTQIEAGRAEMKEKESEELEDSDSASDCIEVENS